ncbi:MAG: restriction endonuclease subunit S [Cytophagia bacterium]|nr:restriction endonuclease subunit S [Cytophagia bacterium]
MNAVPKLRFKEFSETWKTKYVNDIASKLNVGFVGTCEPFYTSKEEGVLLVRTGNLKGVKIILDEEKYVTKEFNEKNKKSQIFPGDLLLARHGGNGEICMVPKGFPAANSLNIVILRTSSEIDSSYFQLSYSTFTVQKQISSVTAGSTQGVINTSEIGKLKITFPSLPEQQKIASFLSAVDEKIQQLTRRKELLEQYKKGVMQQLFTGKLRFKDENGKAYPKWEEKKLEELCDYKNGGSFESLVCDDGAYNLISLNSIDINGKLKSEHKKVSQSDHSLSKGDLVIVLSDVAHGYFLGLSDIIPDDSYVLNQRMGALKPKVKINRYYLKTIINVNQKYFKLMGQGSSQKNLSKGDVLSFQMPLPSLEEQQKIASFLTALDAKIESVAAQIAHTQTFKKGLLQQMFV